MSETAYDVQDESYVRAASGRLDRKGEIGDQPAQWDEELTISPSWLWRTPESASKLHSSSRLANALRRPQRLRFRGKFSPENNIPFGLHRGLLNGISISSVGVCRRSPLRRRLWNQQFERACGRT
jgi:hypothetical protein